MSDLDARLRQQRDALDLASCERPPLPEIGKRAHRQRRDRYIASAGSGLALVLVMVILAVSLTGGDEASNTKLDVVDQAPSPTTNLDAAEADDVPDQPSADATSTTVAVIPLPPTVDAQSGAIVNGSTTTVTSNPDRATSPNLTSQPSDSSVQIRDSATLRVGATGQSPLAYQWYLDGAPIAGATAPSYQTPEHEQRNGSPAYTAQYWAVVTDRSGLQATSRTATVTVTSRNPDIDGDGVVGCYELNLVSANYNADYKPADLNGDHIVNIFDLSVISINWNGPQDSESC